MAKRHISLLLLFCIALTLLTPGCGTGVKRYEAGFLDVFDTATRVVIYDTDALRAQERLDRIHESLKEYHRLFDIYNDYEGINNLKTINDNAGSPVRADVRIIELLEFARYAYELTGGKVNAALGGVLRLWHDCRSGGLDDPQSAALPPMEQLMAAAEHADMADVVIDREAGTVCIADPELRLDVGAIAKGYAAQRVAEEMRSEGVESMLLSIGGNVAAIGSRADGESWKVAVQSPRDEGGQLCVVNVDGKSLVTSGTYQRYYIVDGVRYHHIIDPDTLMPGGEHVSVSILCRDSALADVLSTALLLLPLEEGRALLAGLDAEAMWVAPDGSCTYTDGFRAQLG